MLYFSTAPTASGDDELFDRRMPDIIYEPTTSARPLKTVSDTSGNPTHGKIVRPRFKDDKTRQPDGPRKRDRFQVLKNWEGVVTAIEEDLIFASVRQTNSESERAEDEFEMDIDNVPSGDRELVRVGAVFYLTVGIRRPPGEDSQKTTRVIFRRMPRWSAGDVARAEVAADELWKELHAGDGSQISGPDSEAK